MALKLVAESLPQLKVPGVGRDAENDHSLCFYFNRRPTDDEMRFLHDVMKRAVFSVPEPQP